MARKTAKPKIAEPKRRPPRPNPRDFTAFREWLAGKPHEWSVVIAARAALRVLPLATRGVRAADDAAAIVSPLFRAAVIARFAAVYPSRPVEGAADAAARAAFAAGRAAFAATRDADTAFASAYAADASAYAADAAASASAADAAASASAAAAASASASAADAASSASAAVQEDVQRLGDGMAPDLLARAPLWGEGERPPRDIRSAWAQLAEVLRGFGDHWNVWIGWYDGVLRGAQRTEVEDMAFVDLPEPLPWDDGAEAVKATITARLAALRPDPKPMQGIPSPIGIVARSDGRIGAEAGAYAEPSFPPSLDPQTHARSLAACRSRAESLHRTAASPAFQGRRDYADALEAYAQWLPHAPGTGNMLLADGEARVLNKLFTAEEGILPTGFAARLSVLLEDQIALRAFYPEVERHYLAVRSGRLAVPLGRDAVEAIRKVIDAHTPAVFEPSVKSAMDETARPVPEVRPPAPDDAPPRDPRAPRPPRDPIADIDPEKTRSFTFASASNRIWGLLQKGKDLSSALKGWGDVYEQMKPHIGAIIDWLGSVWPPGGGPPPAAGGG